MIIIYSGLPGSGKSYRLARQAVRILYRNKKAYEKTGVRRQLWSNLKFAETVEQEFGVTRHAKDLFEAEKISTGFITYWTDLEQLTAVRDCDVLMDEVGTYFDSRLWADLPQEVRRWAAQHRKFGIDIFGTAQDFAQIDKSFRRLTSDLLYLTKIIGSRDISSTRPPPKFIWGVTFVRRLDPTVYDELKSKFASTGLPQFMIIDRRGVEVFDTRAEVAFSKDVPLRHIDKRCLKCGLQKAVHV